MAAAIVPGTDEEVVCWSPPAARLLFWPALDLLLEEGPAACMVAGGGGESG